MSCFSCWERIWSPQAKPKCSGNLQPAAAWVRQRLQSLGPEPGPGLHGWADGEVRLFRLRGPQYLKLRHKVPAREALYRCTGVEVFEGPCQLRSCTEGLCVKGFGPLGLPKVILVHFQLPFQAGLVGHPWSDPGCSVVVFFELKEPLESPATRLLLSFLEEQHPKAEGFAESGCLKVVGLLENLEDLDIPAAARPVVRKFNGKPVLIEKESHHRRFGDAVEICVDVRGFNPLARGLLRRLREQLPKSVMQLGILVQGCEDSELPEDFLGVVRIEGLDLLQGRPVSGGTVDGAPARKVDDRPTSPAWRRRLRLCCRRQA
ncbi:unnamed protein product, partial [Effrenium voratum]